ncbi:isoamylase early set domain-containing protein [Nonomuraea sp. NPDC047897]|uniref:isoamylase early set domain-containing protein n=1 Tax=Nonomuraea sp. NPDC047897 TaxID=3364346 RepID=UPI00371B2242
MIRQDEPGENGLVNVTFTLPAEISGPVSVVGDFNDWDAYADPMTRTQHGAHRAVVALPQGSTICFRYLADGGVWLDDPDADSRDERGGIVHVATARSDKPVRARAAGTNPAAAST